MSDRYAVIRMEPGDINPVFHGHQVIEVGSIPDAVAERDMIASRNPEYRYQIVALRSFQGHPPRRCALRTHEWREINRSRDEMEARL